MYQLDHFQKQHDFLICVDSDGCVMDTMNSKHFHCFGPCLVRTWDLNTWRAEILERWNQVNLYRTTRGTNRFRGLALALTEINAIYAPIPGLEGLQKWVDNAAELSNQALANYIRSLCPGAEKECLQKALSWSESVNICIDQLPQELKKPFAHAKTAMSEAHFFADVAVVSSANRSAVEEEWSKHGFAEFVDIMLTQDVGSKAHCIAEMLKFGYAKENVLMVGDAPGDCDAAEGCGVYFYPILVGRETESWQEFQEIALGRLTGGTYGGEYQARKKQE